MSDALSSLWWDRACGNGHAINPVAWAKHDSECTLRIPVLEALLDLPVSQYFTRPAWPAGLTQIQIATRLAIDPKHLRSMEIESTTVRDLAQQLNVPSDVFYAGDDQFYAGVVRHLVHKVQSCWQLFSNGTTPSVIATRLRKPLQYVQLALELAQSPQTISLPDSVAYAVYLRRADFGLCDVLAKTVVESVCEHLNTLQPVHYYFTVRQIDLLTQSGCTPKRIAQPGPVTIDNVKETIRKVATILTPLLKLICNALP